MSGSVSPLPWTGNKGCIYTTIDAFMPPHRTYVEACMGSAEVFLRKKPVEKEIINDYNGDLVRLFRVLQRNENLERLIGRLFLSFNSEQIFRANKALLAEVPNILDDLTETSVIIENTQWNDFDLAVAFYENQVFSFSSTGKNFAITKKDMTKRFGRLIAACARLRNATIMHRDYKDCISYGAGEDAFILLDPPYKGTEDFLDATPTNAKINLCGSRDNPLTELFLQESGESITHIERIAELTCEPCEEYIINLIIEPERVSEYSQATSLRRTTTIEHFDRILDLPEGGNVMNVIFTSSFKMFKTNLPYVAAKVPMRIVGTGDNENLRLAIGENTVLARSNFDTPSQTAIKAYYHNKTSGKTGKVILFRRTL